MPAKDRSQSEELYFYEVDEDGTITQSNFSKPKINRQIFDNISEDSLTTPDNIIYEVEFYNAAVSYLRSLACDEHEALIRRIQRQDYRDDKQLQRMTRLAKALEDEDDGWKKWIKFEGNEGASRFEKVIVDWLAAPVEWQEDMPWNATAQGCAKHFFEGQDSSTLDAHGVGIVEGEHPGSTYYAATLEKSVEDANDIAKKLGLEYRFRKEDKDKS